MMSNVANVFRCRRGELFDYLTEVVTLNEIRTRQFMRQILEAVGFMHSKGIVHRDLKLENILLDDNFNAKLSDFGFASGVDSDNELTDLCGTPGYLAPELLRANMYEKAPGYGRPVDMWCCGVIMYTLLCGFQPFWHNTKMETVMATLNGNFSFDTPEWQDLSTSSKDLITKLLGQDPYTRLTAADALNHPFIRQDDTITPQPRITIDHVISHPLRRFKASAIAVMAARRFAVSRQLSTQRVVQRIAVSRLSSDPYSVRAFRRAIDAGAFRIYHHWVKKGDAQNRGALFEMEPRRDVKRAASSMLTVPLSR